MSARKISELLLPDDVRKVATEAQEKGVEIARKNGLILDSPAIMILGLCQIIADIHAKMNEKK